MSDLIFTEQATGALPAGGKRTVYYKTDGKLYTKNSAGAEVAFPTVSDLVAAAVANTPAGNIAATSVQAALNELDAEKVAITATLPDSVNLNTVVTSGFYRLSASPANAPGTGAGYGQLIVCRGADTIAQTLHYAFAGKVYSRAGNPPDTGGAGTWSAWREVYNAGSILGTVGQAAGVPTGAVIERGSNANGEYVRFADGTQICTVLMSGVLAVSAYPGIAGLNQGVRSWTYPAAFIGTPVCVGGGIDDVRPGWMAEMNGTGNAVNMAYFTATVTIANTAHYLTATGRWF